MLRFVIRKMLNKKWMVLSLLVGNILLISIAASNPMYTDAVLKRTLDTDISNYIEQNNRYPMLIKVQNSGYTNNANAIVSFEDELKNSPERMGLPIKELIHFYSTNAKDTTTDLERHDRRDDLCLAYLTDLDKHIEIVEGRMPEKGVDQDGIFEIVVSERYYLTWEMLLNEVITMPKVKDPDGHSLKNGRNSTWNGPRRQSP